MTSLAAYYKGARIEAREKVRIGGESHSLQHFLLLLPEFPTIFVVTAQLGDGFGRIFAYYQGSQKLGNSPLATWHRAEKED